MSLDVLVCLLFELNFVHVMVVGMIVYLYIGHRTLLKLARLRSVILVCGKLHPARWDIQRETAKYT